MATGGMRHMNGQGKAEENQFIQVSGMGGVLALSSVQPQNKAVLLCMAQPHLWLWNSFLQETDENRIFDVLLLSEYPF